MLSKEAYLVLKQFAIHYSLSDVQVNNISNDIIEFLELGGYIKRDSLGYPDGFHAKYSDYHITEAGKAYVQSRSMSVWWKNNWVSFLSMIFAIIASIPVIMQGIELLLKYIK